MTDGDERARESWAIYLVDGALAVSERSSGPHLYHYQSRTLSVSRATVRKVIRRHNTEFKYERGVQPTPKLGNWIEALTEILEKESKLPKRERRSTQRLFEELRGCGYDGAHESVHRFAKAWRDERAPDRLRGPRVVPGDFFCLM
jgi:hypothetical protein